jgi:ABC-type sugar transport system substrate-binding protein
MLMRRIATLGVLFALPLAAAGCGSDNNDKSSGDSAASSTTASTTAAPAGKKYVIGFSVAKVANPTARALYGGFKAQAEKLGMEVKISDANLDINKQVSDIDSFTNQGVDAIMLQLVGDPNAVRAPLARANKKGIPIFDVDGLPPFPGVRLNAFQPSKEMGIAAAKYIGEDLGGKGTVIMTGGVPIPLLEARVASFTETLKKEFPGVKLLKRADSVPDDENGGRQMGESLLSKYPDLDAIICVNDDIASGVADAVKSAGRDVKVIGMNGSKNGIDRVKQGTIAATFDGLSLEIGQKAADEAKKILDGTTKEEVTTFTLQPVLYTKDNVDKWVDPFERIDFPKVP